MKDEEAVVSMGHNLSAYYRYMTRIERPMASLYEEVQLIINYLDIQKLRNGRIHYQIAISDEMLKQQVPRLMLQPIVENAVIHGVGKSYSSGEIRITGEMSDGFCKLYIDDDGPGMLDEQLVMLNRKMREPLQEDMGYGLWNTNQRINHQFGDKSHISFTKSDIGGFRTEMKENGQMQMIIVDDEAHWVDNLSTTKPWHTLGIETVHKAYSAQEALRILETHPIDIVISDVLMPEMTGIELIAKIRERDNRIKCIILSGYSDFEYTKEALRHHAVDYLLKPPTDNELLGAVKLAVDQLEEEWRSISSYERIEYTLRENLPLLRGQLLLNTLRGERLPAEEWSRKLESYKLPIRFGECALLLVRMEEDFGQYHNKDQHLMEYAIINIAEEIFGEFTHVWGVKEEHGYLAFLLQFKDEHQTAGKETKLEKSAMQLQSKVKQFLKGSLSIVMTDPFHFPDMLPNRYRHALDYFRQIVGKEREFVMRACDLESHVSHGALDIIHAPPGLKNLLEAGRWEVVEQKLNEVFAELDEKWSDSWEHCLEAGYTIASCFTHFAHRNGHTLVGLLGQDIELLQSGEAFASIGKLRSWAFGALGKLKEGTSNEVKNIRSVYVKKIQRFVETNLHDDVSLRALADHVNLHPTHLSKLYKIETGEGVSDFVSRLRMETACHKLKTTDKKVYEISAEIGYLDPAYFIKVFKRQFGSTPQEYREEN
ncbi:unnamed protein product [Aphanomyces euteiches]